MDLSYTLVADGSADRALLPILDWVLSANGYGGGVQGEWCDFRLLGRPSRFSLAQRVGYALRLYPCDLLFVHRDAEGASREVRVEEINAALNETFAGLSCRVPAVCVVPVRMTEAWLLLDEAAIRRAAGNPNGRERLDLPSRDGLERLPNPKNILYRAVAEATGLSVRRQRRFRVGYSVSQITQYIEDFSPLRQLAAFVRLESDVRQIILSTILPGGGGSPLRD